MNTQFFLEALGQIDEAMVCDAHAPMKARPVRRRVYRTALLAAVCSLLLIVGASAVGGQVVQLRSHSLFGPQYHYTSYRGLPRAEKLLGYAVQVPECFSNGYAFQEMSIDQSEAVDENGAVLYRYFSLEVRYGKEGATDLSLSIHPDVGMGMRGTNTPTAVTEQDGVTMEYDRSTYKIVPVDYQVTAEDRARQAQGHFYLSWGSDQVEVRPMSGVNFTLDGTVYLLFGFLDMSADEAFQMAGEILQAGT